MKSSKIIHQEKRILQCACLLLSVNVGNSLKLTPVRNLTHKFVLNHEAKAVSWAFDEAKALIYNDGGDPLELDASTLLHNRTIKKLYSTIERWNSFEEKLRYSIPKDDQKQMNVFDEAVSIIAASRVLLGFMFWRSNEYDMALKNLELSCPILWEYDIAKTSLDSDGWLDCYSTLGDIYIRTSRIEQAIELEKDLMSRMPWLALTFSRKPTYSKLRSFGNISHLTLATPEERFMISIYIKNAWKTAEDLRASLNELVNEFVLAETSKRRMSVYIRAQHYVEEAIQHFVQESNIKILYESNKHLHSVDLNRSSQSPLASSKKEIADKAITDEGSAIEEGDSVTRKRESTFLNTALRVELHREANYYLIAMDSIIKGGTDLLVPEYAMASSSSSSALFLALSIAAVPPMGFQSRDQVTKVFEYLFAHQAERQEQAEAAKHSASVANTTRSAGGASDLKIKSIRPTSSSQEKKKKANVDSSVSIGTFWSARFLLALFAICGYIIKNVVKVVSDENHYVLETRSRIDRQGSRSNNRVEKQETDSGKTEDGSKQVKSIVLKVIVILIGIDTVNRISHFKEEILPSLQNVISKILSLLYVLVMQAAPLVQWIGKQIEIFQTEWEKLRRKVKTDQGVNTTPMTTWTTPNLLKPTAVNGRAKKSVSVTKSKRVDSPSGKAAVPNDARSKKFGVIKKDVKEHKHNQIATLHQAPLLKVVGMDTEIILAPQTLAGLIAQADIRPEDVLDKEEKGATRNDKTKQLEKILSAVSLESPEQLCRVINNEQYCETDIPSSSVSVTSVAYDDIEQIDRKIFEDFNWNEVDDEVHGDGNWIETSTPQTRNKTRKAQIGEKMSRRAVSALRQRQELFHQQQYRKTTEAAFSSAVMSTRDSKASAHGKRPVQRKTSVISQAPPSASFQAPLSVSSQPATSLSSQVPTIVSSHVLNTVSSQVPISSPTLLLYSSGVNAEMCSSPRSRSSATAALKSLLSRDHSLSQKNNRKSILVTNDFTPLPCVGPSSNHSQISSIENSTDVEDHSSMSDDSHKSSPSPRSFACSRTLSCERLHLQDDTYNTMSAMQQSQTAPIPYYPVGYMTMPHQMPCMTYDPNISFVGQGIPDYLSLTLEQQHNLMAQQTRQGMMTMPFSHMYMMAPQFDSMGHQLSLPQMQTKEQFQPQYVSQPQAFYGGSMQVQSRTQASQNQDQSQHSRHRPNKSKSLSTQPVYEVEIVAAVREQIEYYFSSSNLCHDMYLRSKMDSEGYVRLSEIANWNRILKLGASCHMILESVLSSSTLEVVEEFAVHQAKGNIRSMEAFNSNMILATRIRCVQDPLLWLPTNTPMV